MKASVSVAAQRCAYMDNFIHIRPNLKLMKLISIGSALQYDILIVMINHSIENVEKRRKGQNSVKIRIKKNRKKNFEIIIC